MHTKAALDIGYGDLVFAARMGAHKEIDAVSIALVNGRRVHGALPHDTYTQVIEATLARTSRWGR